jgi:hypothetical protein
MSRRRQGGLWDGRPAELLLRLGCDSAGKRGQAGRLLGEALPLLAECEGSLSPPLALVFGSGASMEALELLRRGWTVVAFEEASATTAGPARLTIETTPVQDAALPLAELIYTGAALPFRARSEFETLWARIVRSLRPGGWFVGHLLGKEDCWAHDCDLTVFSREQVARLFSGFRVELLRERETSTRHEFEVIGCRRPMTGRGG